MAKLYDTAVLKIPKVIPSDNESIYSECNSSFSRSRFGDTDPYSRRNRRLNKTDKLDEADEEDLYEVIKSEAEERTCDDDDDDDSCSQTGSDVTCSDSDASGSDVCDVYVNKFMASGQTSDVTSSDDEDDGKAVMRTQQQQQQQHQQQQQQQQQQRRHCDISSMGKMIVTIGGGNNSNEASVSSGKLLIEVRDDRAPPKPKPAPKKKKKWPETPAEEDSDNFDPDTLERGLGDRKRPVSDRLRKVSSPQSSVISSDFPNPDYSFRLFDNGKPVEKPVLPPELPPKIRGPSSVYSSTSVSVSSMDISKSDISKPDKPKVPPKAKQKAGSGGSGLTAERKQYFEGLAK